MFLCIACLQRLVPVNSIAGDAGNHFDHKLEQSGNGSGEADVHDGVVEYLWVTELRRKEVNK
jgi:hypothetical protein